MLKTKKDKELSQVSGPRRAPITNPNHPLYDASLLPKEEPIPAALLTDGGDVAPPPEETPEVAQDETPAPKAAEAKKGPRKPAGIRDWNESVGGVSAKRMKNCIVYHLDVAKGGWWATKINTKGRGFLRNEKMARQMDADTPEDFDFGFVYDPDSLIKMRTIHVDGESEPRIRMRVARMPRSEDERTQIRDRFGV